MPSKTLLLIRHAQSTWNALGRWQGHGDPPLSAAGQGQARDLGARLRGEPVDHLICSDLLRTRATAEIVGEALGLEPTPDPRLRELEVGRWTGLTREQIAARDPDLLQQFESLDPSVRPGGGESRADMRLRVRGAVHEWVTQRPEARFALVVHLGVIRALLPGSEPENVAVVRTSWDEIKTAIEATGEQSPSGLRF